MPGAKADLVLIFIGLDLFAEAQSSYENFYMYLRTAFVF